MHTNRTRPALIPSAIYKSDQVSDPHTITSGCRLIVYVDVTAVVGGGTVTPVIEEQLPTGNEWFPLLTGAALSATGQNRYEIGPGIPAVANKSAPNAIAGRYRVRCSFGGNPATDSITYAVSAYEPIGG